MRKLTCIGSLIALLVTGCGGGDGGGINEGPSVETGTADVAAMKTGAEEAASLNAALTSGNGEAVAGGALALSGLGMSAAQSKDGSGFALSVAQALTTMENEPATTGTKECSASSCTFKDYGVQGFTLTGSVTATDVGDGAKNVVWNMTGTGDTDAFGGADSGVDFKFTWSWKGDVTVSSTSLEGAAGSSGKGSGSAEGQSFSFEYGSFVKFTGVVLTGTGCPSGGTMMAKWWVNAKSGGRSQTQGAQASHTFNGCS